MRTELNLRKTMILKLGACLGALAIPFPAAVAAADDAAPSPAPAPAPGGFTYADPSAPSVFADGSTLLAPVAGLLGDVVRVHGTLAGTHPGDGVVVQRLDETAGWGQAATATVDGDGAFDAVWKPDHSGHTKLRVIPAGQATASSGGDDELSARALTVFHRARATWYGPGFYGRKTACGTRLRKATLGVAHKTLPCGTLVDLYMDGRTVTVPVIDRGPFRKGTSYDLTAATAQALGMTGTSVIGAVRSAVPAPAAG
jgi:rare lipoprotein A